MEVRIVFCLCVLLHCILMASSFTEKVLYSTAYAIKEFDIDTRNVTVLVKLEGDVYAMDYDYNNRFIYFPRLNMHDIVRFPYPSDNTTLQTIVHSVSYPSGIAVDSINDHLYWVDYNYNKLSRCTLDGRNVTVLSTLSNPWVIRLDVTDRWIYIVERDIGISKLRFDLLEKETIINFVSTPVYCMDIDTDENRLFWIIDNTGELKSAKDDGSDVKKILSTKNSANKLAIRVFGSYIFYADNNKLLMVAKTTGSMPTVLYNETSRITSMFVYNLIGM